MSRPRNAESVFRAIADPTRRRMIELLRLEERSVGELVRELKLKRAVASHHLGVLLQAGVLKQVRRGRNLHCRIDTNPLRVAHAWMCRQITRPSRDSRSDIDRH